MAKDSEEFDKLDGKRLWWKFDDITEELFSQHLTPTVYHPGIAILTTEQYVPPFLKVDAFKTSGNY